MGHSFVEFKDRTRMLNDIEIVTVVHIVLDMVRQASDSLQLTDQVRALVDSWSALIDTYGPGLLDIDLNQFLRTDADRDSLLELLRASRDMLERFGPLIPGEYLNRIVDAPGVLEFVDRPTSEVQDAFDKFIELLMEE